MTPSTRRRDLDRGDRIRHREAVLLVTAVLVGPALLIGVLVTVAARRYLPRRRSDVGDRALRRFAVVGFAACAALLGGLGLLVRAQAGGLGVDRSIAPWGWEHATALARRTLDAVTSLGSSRGIVVAAVVVLVVETIRRPNLWVPVFLAVVCVGDVLLSSALKDVFDRARPTVNPLAATLGPAFPSGHTTAAAAGYAALAFVLARGRSRNAQAALAGAAVAVACAVAATRVLLGVHWLTDVLGGLALGWGFFLLCAIGFGALLFGPASPRVRPSATGPKRRPGSVVG